MYILSRKQMFRWKLLLHHIILSAVLFALENATDFTRNLSEPVTMFTGIQAAMSPIQNRKNLKIIQSNFLECREQLHCRVPGNTEISEDKVADQAAKEAAQSQIPLSLHMSDLGETYNGAKKNI